MKWFRPAEAAVLKGCSKSTIERALKRGDLVAKRGKISEADLALFQYADTPEAAWEVIRGFYQLAG